MNDTHPRLHQLFTESYSKLALTLLQGKLAIKFGEVHACHTARGRTSEELTAVSDGYNHTAKTEAQWDKNRSIAANILTLLDGNTSVARDHIDVLAFNEYPSQLAKHVLDAYISGNPRAGEVRERELTRDLVGQLVKQGGLGRVQAEQLARTFAINVHAIARQGLSESGQ